MNVISLFQYSIKLNIIIVLIVLLAIFSLISTLPIRGDSYSENIANTAAPVTINVLIYNGDGVISSSVNGIKNYLEYSNKENTVTNVHFNYSTTKKINSEILSSYDVLIVPGGLGKTYLNDPDIDVSDLKNFVYEGNGYVGICAGSYVASSHVDGYYDGWGIAPHINCKSVDYVGNLPISLTTHGKEILNNSEVGNIYEWNGPAMYKKANLNDSLAKYDNNKTSYQNYAAIMDDQYGSGRVILSGPHPELSPSKPEILDRMIIWASQKI